MPTRNLARRRWSLFNLPALRRLWVGGCSLAGTLMLSTLSAQAPGAEEDAALVYEQQVLPILERYCFKCHGAETRMAGLDLRTVASRQAGSLSGPVIQPGHPEESLLFEMVNSRKMPPKEELSDDHIELIRRWIAAQAPKDPSETARFNAEISMDAEQVSSEDRAWWAFRNLTRPTVPAVKEPNLVRTSIDAFVLARLEEKGLCFSAPAARNTLIRRAYFDLIGLPPTPKEVDALAASGGPDAFARQIDRLLDLPHFGERWGRHWLDYAGYVDVYGSDENAATIRLSPGK